MIIHLILALDMTHYEVQELFESVGLQPISVQIPREGTRNLSISKGDCTMMEYEEGDELVTIKICRRRLLVTSDQQPSVRPKEPMDQSDQDSSSDESSSDSDDSKQKTAAIE